MYHSITSWVNYTSLLQHAVADPLSSYGAAVPWAQGTSEQPLDGTETAVQLRAHQTEQRGAHAQPWAALRQLDDEGKEQ